MKNAGVWASIVIMVFAGIFIWNSTKIPYEGELGFGPGFFPFWLSILLFILGVLYFIISLKEKIILSEIFPKGRTLLDFGLIIVSMSVFVFLVEKTGFVIAGTLALIILLFRTFKWVNSIALSFGITLVVYIIFAKALTIPLPVNALGW